MVGSLYVVDTCALISYFENVFEQESSISDESIKIIDRAFHGMETKLIFPSTVFVELCLKWFKTEEMAKKVEIEVFRRIQGRGNMEIQPFDTVVLQSFIRIRNIERNHNFDNHDKQILAAAMAMNCPLISSDKRIRRYNIRNAVIPRVCF